MPPKYSQRKTRRPTKKRPTKRRSAPRAAASRGSLSAAEKAYSAALVDATSPAAIGAKVLDGFGVPSSAEHQKRRLKVYSDNNGQADLVLYGHAYFAALSNSVNTDAAAAANKGGISGTGQYANSQEMWKMTDPVTMRKEAAAFRIVSSGAKIRNEQNLHDGKGTLVCATVPTTEHFYPPHALENGNLDYSELIQKSTGITPLAYTSGGTGIAWEIPPAIQDLPNSKELTFQQLALNDLRVTNKPCNASHSAFQVVHDTIYGDGTGDNDDPINVLRPEGETGHVYAGMGADDLTSGVPSAGRSGTIDQSRLGGFTCTLLKWTGCPANTLIADVELVTHYEVTPQLLTSETAFAKSSFRSPSSSLWQYIMDSASRIGSTHLWGDKQSSAAISSFVNGVGRQVGYGVGSWVANKGPGLARQSFYALQEQLGT